MNIRDETHVSTELLALEKRLARARSRLHESERDFEEALTRRTNWRYRVEKLVKRHHELVVKKADQKAPIGITRAINL